LGLALVRWRYREITITVITLFVVHSVLRAFGLFGSAGYPRYFVCVAPATALLVLVGWNWIAHRLSWLWPATRIAFGGAVIAASLWLCFIYFDGISWPRDARAVEEMHAWWKANERPVTALVWSQAYQNILVDRDPLEKPRFTWDHDHNMQLLRNLPRGTLVFWDGKTGPSFYRITADDVEAAGFLRLRSRSYVLSGYVENNAWFDYGGPVEHEMHLLYKE
jgi:4-amino-4-deoxy-L-arabinose transferase-like glycosyltransferase